ncbi:hypothetical protein GCM10011487_44990 [Steroidobacter agaridevorans]|uniref:Uncharacterized protein n=1 Tax=Steroidobacter agaridevorans TaxID=2695856 RepID=A0A829YGY1_9GAMM|nr:hypothetical protein GCM10011487_44990 [Steroidobacter agaridevorans]
MGELPGIASNNHRIVALKALCFVNCADGFIRGHRPQESPAAMQLSQASLHVAEISQPDGIEQFTRIVDMDVTEARGLRLNQFSKPDQAFRYSSMVRFCQYAPGQLLYQGWLAYCRL